MSDPALAEGGVIRRHSGIIGVVNALPHLDPEINDWRGTVARIEVKRIG